MTRRAKLANLCLAAATALSLGAVASSPAAGGALASRASCPGQGNANAPGAAPISIFRMWMHSQGHRENILGPYRDMGLGLRVGTLEGYAGAHVWTEEFGAPCS